MGLSQVSESFHRYKIQWPSEAMMMISLSQNILIAILLMTGCAAPKAEAPAGQAVTNTSTVSKASDSQTVSSESGAVDPNASTEVPPNVETANVVTSTLAAGTGISTVSSSTTVPVETPSPVVVATPTPAIVTTCGGYKLGGAGCWYASATGESCTALCMNHGGVEQILINATQCEELVRSVGLRSNLTKSVNTSSVPYGCYYWPLKGGYMFSNSPVDDPNASSNAIVRMCNCVN